MRILWVTPILPSLLSGTAVRQLNLIKLLTSHGTCTVLSFLTDQEAPHVDRLKGLCNELHTVQVPAWVSPGRWRNRLRSLSQTILDPLPHFERVYPVDAMRPVFQNLLQRQSFDVVHFVSLHQARLRPTCAHLPTTLTAMDVDSVKQRRACERETRLVRRVQGYVEWWKLRRFESKWVGRYDAIAAMSEVDANQLRLWAQGAPVFVVPNGVDTDRFAPPSPNSRQEQRLIFIGNMSYAPNVQGIRYFCQQVLPLVRAEVPDVEVDIVGPGAPPEVERLGMVPGVSVTGFSDVRPYLWRSALSIVPLLVGSGTRLKILESLAAGCPVVSTSLGAEGLDLKNGRDILLADNPREFAGCVVELIRDETLRKVLASHGREAVCSGYDWRLVAPRLLEVWQTAIDRHRHRQPKPDMGPGGQAL